MIGRPPKYDIAKLRIEAKTMTCSELADKYGISYQNMNILLRKNDIKQKYMAEVYKSALELAYDMELSVATIYNMARDVCPETSKSPHRNKERIFSQAEREILEKEAKRRMVFRTKHLKVTPKRKKDPWEYKSWWDFPTIPECLMTDEEKAEEVKHG